MAEEIIDSLTVGTGTPFDALISTSGGIRTIFNNNNRDIDFQIKSTGINSSLYYDASTARLGIGITGAPDAALHVVTPCAREGLILESNTNCSTGVVLLLLHKPGNAPGTGDYPATINLAGRDNNSSVINYAQIKSKILDPQTSKTSGELVFLVDNTGALNEAFSVNISKLVLGTNNAHSGGSYNIVGQQNFANGSAYILIGNNNSGVGINNSFIAGNNNAAFGPDMFVVSSNSDVSGAKIFSFGNNNSIVGNSGIICGLDSSVNGSYNLFLLDASSVNSSSSVGFVRNSNISGSSGVFLGLNINSSGSSNLSIGGQNTLIGNKIGAIGSDIVSNGSSNIILGNVVLLSGNNIVSIGSNQNITGIINGIFVGNNVNLSDTSNVLYIGFNNATDNSLNNSVILGGNNSLDNGVLSNIILLGQNNSTLDVLNTILVGNNNIASGTIKNDIIFGSGNALTNDSYNTICIGTLSNQTGVYVGSDGSVVGTPRSISSVNTNSVILGIQNISYLNLSNIVIGNKNNTSGSYINNIGSFNSAINTNKAYILGNSNLTEGNNISVIGSNVFVAGDDNLILNHKNSTSSVYGSGSISVGHNQNISSGNIIVGYDNEAGVSGLIYGKNNIIGIASHLFTYTSGSNQIVIGTSSSPYTPGSKVLLHIMNPVVKDSVQYAQLNTVSSSTQNMNTTMSVNITLPWSERYNVINNNFDDNASRSFVGSGIVILLGNDDINTIYYGANNTVMGNNNYIPLSNTIVVGDSNIASGTNSIIIGSNITGTTDNTAHIGTSNLNKIVISDSSIVFNTGTIQQSIVVRSTTGTITQYYDLSTSRLGINNSAPRSDLDVSGTVTAANFRMGLSSNSGYVMTSDLEGNASWVLPVRISGIANGLLFNNGDSNKIAGSTTDIKAFVTKDANNSDSYSLNFYENFYINKTGIILNANKGNSIPATKFIVWGSGGGLSPKVFEIDPTEGASRVNMYNLYSVSGMMDQLNVTSLGHVKLPNIASGTILALSGDRSLIGRIFAPHSIVYSNRTSNATGNPNFRWFNENSILALGGSNPNNDDFFPQPYNIILSSSGTQDTIFNNLGFGNDFVVFRSGSPSIGTDKIGFHIIGYDGRVGVNLTKTQLTSSTYSDSHLAVNGQITAGSFKIKLDGGASPPSGLYLRMGENGAVVAAGASFDTTFSGLYPIVTTTNSNASLTTTRLASTERNGITNFNTHTGFGRTLVIDDSGDWLVASGLHVYQSDAAGRKGVLIGYNGSFIGPGPNTNNEITPELLPGYYYCNVFDGGGFNSNSQTIRGTSQFSQFFLRTRTTDNVAKFMTMDWSRTNETARSFYNTIKFPSNARGVWTYTAYVNVLWSGNNTSTVGAAGYIINGAVGKMETALTALGDYSITGWKSSNDVGHLVKPYINAENGNAWALDFQVSGSNLYTMFWSSTININQLHWPSDSLFI